MPSQVPDLFTPLKVGPYTVQNRVVLAPLARDRSRRGVVTDSHVKYYTQRAKGGQLLVTEGIMIVQQGSHWQHTPGIWNEEQIDAWKRVIDSVHAVGGVMFAQLWHLGRIAHPDAPAHIASGQPVYAPSALAARGGRFKFLPGEPDYATPTAIDNPRDLVALHKQAAINAKLAGFDGIELIVNGGYLIQQFMDSTANHRTDEYGGSVENRARFALEVLDAFIDVYGANRVAVKVMPAGGHNDVGMPLKDTIETYSYFIARADAMKVAFITIRRVPLATAMSLLINGKPRATQHDELKIYRPLIKNAKFLLSGAVTPEEGTALIKEGKIDAVSFGWLYISNPDLARRLKEGKPLNMNVDAQKLYGGQEGMKGFDWEAGYTDYPVLE